MTDEETAHRRAAVVALLKQIPEQSLPSLRVFISKARTMEEMEILPLSVRLCLQRGHRGVAMKEAMEVFEKIRKEYCLTNKEFVHLLNEELRIEHWRALGCSHRKRQPMALFSFMIIRTSCVRFINKKRL